MASTWLARKSIGHESLRAGDRHGTASSARNPGCRRARVSETAQLLPVPNQRFQAATRFPDHVARLLVFPAHKIADVNFGQGCWSPSAPREAPRRSPCVEAGGIMGMYGDGRHGTFPFDGQGEKMLRPGFPDSARWSCRTWTHPEGIHHGATTGMFILGLLLDNRAWKTHIAAWRALRTVQTCMTPAVPCVDGALPKAIRSWCIPHPIAGL